MIDHNFDERCEVERLREGGEAALAVYFNAHRQELQRLIRLRLDRRIARRIDDSDIIQETYVESCNRLAAYLEAPHLPPSAWLRRLARQVVARIQRDHFATQKRDIRRETYGSPILPLDLLELSAAISPPDAKISREEMQGQIIAVVEGMNPIEREILVLVHVESLTVRQAAIELDITLEAAKKRYRRALLRLRELTGDLADSHS